MNGTENSYSIHAYQTAFLVYDNNETWLAACKTRSTEVINDIVKTFGASPEPIPILFRDSLCNWTGLLVSTEGNFYGFLPLSEQPSDSLSGRPLANFLSYQFEFARKSNFRYQQHA